MQKLSALLALCLLMHNVTSYNVKDKSRSAEDVEERFVAAAPVLYPAAVWAGRAALTRLAKLAAAAGAAYWLTKKEKGHSIPCHNNRGWCRPTCFSHEKENHYASDICGGNKCCTPTNL